MFVRIQSNCHCDWEAMAPLWKSVWQFVKKKKKLNLQRPQGQYLHTPEHRPQSSEVHGHVTMYTVVTAALFVTLQAGSNGKVLA